MSISRLDGHMQAIRRTKSVPGAYLIGGESQPASQSLSTRTKFGDQQYHRGLTARSACWPPDILLPRTGMSFRFFIESFSSVCCRVPLLLLSVFSFFSTFSPWLVCCVSSNGLCLCFVSTVRHRTVV